MYPISSVCEGELWKKRKNILGSSCVDDPYLNFVIVDTQSVYEFLDINFLSTGWESSLDSGGLWVSFGLVRAIPEPDINLSAKATSLINNVISQIMSL